jgi:hypothetical protein
MSAGRDATTVKMEDLIGEEVAAVFTVFEARRGGNDGFGVGGESGTPKFSGKILRIVTEFPRRNYPVACELAPSPSLVLRRHGVVALQWDRGNQPDYIRL